MWLSLDKIGGNKVQNKLDNIFIYNGRALGNMYIIKCSSYGDMIIGIMVD